MRAIAFKLHTGNHSFQSRRAIYCTQSTQRSYARLDESIFHIFIFIETFRIRILINGIAFCQRVFLSMCWLLLMLLHAACRCVCARAPGRKFRAHRNYYRLHSIGMKTNSICIHHIRQ